MTTIAAARNVRTDLCQWEEGGWCCGDGTPMSGSCFRLAGCGCKAEPHRPHVRTLVDNNPHPNDRR